MLYPGHTTTIFLGLVVQPHSAILTFADGGHLAFNKLNSHGHGILKKLFIPFAKGADVHIIDGDVCQRQGT